MNNPVVMRILFSAILLFNCLSGKSQNLENNRITMADSIKADNIQKILDLQEDSLRSFIYENKPAFTGNAGQYKISRDTICRDSLDTYCENLRYCTFIFYLSDTNRGFRKIVVAEGMKCKESINEPIGRGYSLYFYNDMLVKSEVYADKKLVYYYTREENVLDDQSLKSKPMKTHGWKYELLRQARFWSKQFRNRQSHN
jgi:hypothetical protein